MQQSSSTSGDEKNIDYNPLSGFTTPAVRIDPHTYEIDVPAQPDLRQLAEILRDRRSGPNSSQDFRGPQKGD
jgi:hypothetical protein